MSRKNKLIIIGCVIGVIILIVFPLIYKAGSEFSGSDDSGSEAVSQVLDREYIPWFVPIMEQFLGGEIPGELESLLFCIQTGIGVGILAFFIGLYYERYQLAATKRGRERYKEYIRDYEDSEKT